MTTISANVTNVQGWLPFADPSSIEPGFYTIDSESVELQGIHLAVPGLGWTPPNGRWCVRGVGGSTKATHSSGATITRYYPEAPGAPTLAAVLVAGADTGEHVITTPFGTIDGTSGAGEFDFAGLAGVVKVSAG